VSDTDQDSELRTCQTIGADQRGKRRFACMGNLTIMLDPLRPGGKAPSIRKTGRGYLGAGGRGLERYLAATKLSRGSHRGGKNLALRSSVLYLAGKKS